VARGCGEHLAPGVLASGVRRQHAAANHMLQHQCSPGGRTRGGVLSYARFVCSLISTLDDFVWVLCIHPWKSNFFKTGFRESAVSLKIFIFLLATTKSPSTETNTTVIHGSKKLVKSRYFKLILL